MHVNRFHGCWEQEAEEDDGLDMWLREAKWFDRPMALAMVWNMKCLSPARSSASTQRPSPQWRSWSRRSASQRSMNPWLSKLCCLFAEQVGGEGSIFVAGHPVRFGDEGQHCTHGDSTVQVGLELQEGGPQASSCRHFFLWQVCAVFYSRVITPPSNQVIDTSTG